MYLWVQTVILLVNFLTNNLILAKPYLVEEDQGDNAFVRFGGGGVLEWSRHNQYYRVLDRYIIACHSTDFDCFRRQYRYLRDNVLLGNKRLGVPYYEPFTFLYGNDTCVRLIGLESSELTGIQLDPVNKEFTWTLELPFKIQQVFSDSARCVKPGEEYQTSDTPAGRWQSGAHTGRQINISSSSPLKKFTGNATIQVTYPFLLKLKKNGIHLSLSDENLDVILDIPDLSHYNNESQFEKNLYEMSEWAYSVVQDVDAAQHFALPFTSRFRAVTEILPMRRFFLLYPDEDFPDLNFKYLGGNSKCYEKLI